MIFEFYAPHAQCVLYDMKLVWLSVAGNLLTALAYFLIPLSLSVGTWKLRDLLRPYEAGIFLHGAAFIGLCGTTHIMSAWNWFHTNYWAEAIVVMATGVISITFAFRLRQFIKHRFMP